MTLGIIDWVTNTTQAVTSGIASVISGIFNAITSFFNSIWTIITLIFTKLVTFIDILQKAYNMITSILVEIPSWLIPFIIVSIYISIVYLILNRI